MKKQVFRETDGIRGKVGVEPLTEISVLRLGRAIGKYFKGGKIIIGRDARESGEWICDKICEGVNIEGGEIWDVGKISTPGLAYLAKNEDVTGGVMVTASHNPADENGIKVFDGTGNKLTDENELEIEKLFFAENGAGSEKRGERLSREELIDDYVNEMTNGVDLKGLKVYVDSAAGGAWGLSARILEKVGAKAEEVGPTPDGKNINENCGAGHSERIAEIVKFGKVDAGVALDGDADRIILVDDEGVVWDGDRIVAALALSLKSEGKLRNDTVVMTEYSNYGAVQFLEKNGVVVEKVVNGDRAVAQKCEESGAVLGGELAGHIIYLPWLNSSDGMYAALWILSIAQKMGIKLSELRPEYDNLPSKQWAINVREKKPLEMIAGWEQEVEAQNEFLAGGGRIFARYSGTEDKLRILVEADDAEKMELAGEALSKIIRKEIGND